MYVFSPPKPSTSTFASPLQGGGRRFDPYSAHQTGFVGDSEHPRSLNREGSTSRCVGRRFQRRVRRWRHVPPAASNTRAASSSAPSAAHRLGPPLLPAKPARRSRPSSATSSARRVSASRTTPKYCAPSSIATSPRCGQQSSATVAACRSSSAMRSWPSSACRSPTKTTDSGRSAPASRCRSDSRR